MGGDNSPSVPSPGPRAPASSPSPSSSSLHSQSFRPLVYLPVLNWPPPDPGLLPCSPLRQNRTSGLVTCEERHKPSWTLFLNPSHFPQFCSLFTRQAYIRVGPTRIQSLVLASKPGEVLKLL